MVHIKEFRLTADLLQATPEQVYDLFELVTYQGRVSMVVSNETKTNFFTAPVADYVFDPDNATATLTTTKIEEYLDTIGEEAVLLIFDSSLQVDLKPALEGDRITPEALTEEFLKRDLQDLRAPAIDRLPANSVDTQHLAPGAVDTDAIADGAIESRHIKEDAITGDKIKKGTVFEVEGLIDGAQISTGALKNRHIPDGTLTLEKVDPEALKLAPTEDFFSDPRPGIVSSKKIANNAITSDKIAPQTIESEHIKDGAITSANIAPGSISGYHIKDDSIGVESLDRNAILGAEVTPQSVTSRQVVNNSLRREDFEEGTFNDGEPLVRDQYLRNLDLHVENDPEDPDTFVQPLRAVFTYRDKFGHLRPGKLAQDDLFLTLDDPINIRYNLDIKPLRVSFSIADLKVANGLRRLAEDGDTGRLAVPEARDISGISLPGGEVPVTDPDDKPKFITSQLTGNGNIIVAYMIKGKALMPYQQDGWIKPKEKKVYTPNDGRIEQGLNDVLFEYAHVDQNINTGQDFLDADYYNCIVIEKRDETSLEVEEFLMYPVEAPKSFYEGTNMSTGTQQIHLTHTGGDGPLKTPLTYEIEDGSLAFKDRIGLLHPEVSTIGRDYEPGVTKLQVESNGGDIIVGFNYQSNSDFGSNLCLALVAGEHADAFVPAPGTTGSGFDKYVWAGGQGRGMNIYKTRGKVFVHYAYNPHLDIVTNHSGARAFEGAVADDKLVPLYAKEFKTKYYPGVTRQNTGSFFDNWSYMFQHTRVERLSISANRDFARVNTTNFSPITKPLLNCAYADNFFDNKDSDLLAKEEAERVPDVNPTHPVNLFNTIGMHTYVTFSKNYILVNVPFNFTYYNNLGADNGFVGRAGDSDQSGLTFAFTDTAVYPQPAGSNVNLRFTDSAIEGGIQVRYTGFDNPPFDTLTGGVYIGDVPGAPGSRKVTTMVKAAFDMGTRGFSLFAEPIWKFLKTSPRSFTALGVKSFDTVSDNGYQQNRRYINENDQVCTIYTDQYPESEVSDGRAIEVPIVCNVKGIAEDPLEFSSDSLITTVKKKLSQFQHNVFDIDVIPNTQFESAALEMTWRFGDTTTYVFGAQSNVTAADLSHFFHGVLRNETDLAVVPGSIIEGFSGLIPGARYTVDDDGEWIRTGGVPLTVALSPTEMRIATPACANLIDYRVYPPDIRYVAAPQPQVDVTPPPTPVQLDPMTVWIGWREEPLTADDAASAEFMAEYTKFESRANIRTNRFTFTLPEGTNDKHLVIVMTDEMKKLFATEIFLGGSFINQEGGFNKILDTAALNVYQSNNKLLTAVFENTDIQVRIRRED